MNIFLLLTLTILCSNTATLSPVKTQETDVSNTKNTADSERLRNAVSKACTRCKLGYKNHKYELCLLCDIKLVIIRD